MNLVLHTLLASSAQGFPYLYSMKEIVFDPSLPWVKDDRFATKMMRLINLVFVTSVTSVVFAYEVHPKVYYKNVVCYVKFLIC